MTHLSTSTGLRIASTIAALLLVDSSLAAQASANWQPRASLVAQDAAQSPAVRADAFDWQPRRAMAGGLRIAADAGSSWAPRASVSAARPVPPVAEMASAAWAPRRAVAVAAGPAVPAAAGWTPRASLKADPAAAGSLSRTRQTLAPAAAPERLITSLPY